MGCHPLSERTAAATTSVGFVEHVSIAVFWTRSALFCTSFKRDNYSAGCALPRGDFGVEVRGGHLGGGCSSGFGLELEMGWVDGGWGGGHHFFGWGGWHGASPGGGRGL